MRRCGSSAPIRIPRWGLGHVAPIPEWQLRSIASTGQRGIAISSAERMRISRGSGRHGRILGHAGAEAGRDAGADPFR